MLGADDPTDGEYTEEAGAALLDAAMSTPAAAISHIRRLLRHSRRPAASVVWQALALAERQTGDVAAAIRHLKRAAAIADSREPLPRQADVRASLAATLAIAGRSREALLLFEGVAAIAHGQVAARADMRRAAILWVLGQPGDAEAALRRCLPALRRSGDRIWEARATLVRALILLDRGATAPADADLRRAETLFEAAGQKVAAARVWHNGGLAHYLAGDLPLALEQLGRAAERHAELNANEPNVEVDRCRVSLAAGLPADGAAHARRAIELAAARTIPGPYRAECELVAAEAALAATDLASARTHAALAARLFRRLGHERGGLLAGLVEAQARWASGEHDVRLLRLASRVAEGLSALRAVETARAQLVAGRIALRTGNRQVAGSWLTRAARQRARGAALNRAAGWLAHALWADAAGSSRGVFSAVRSGLRVLDEHRLSLGATEMRAAATAHGAELAALAVRHAARRSPRELLIWSERWRATTSALPPVRPPLDKALTADLGRLREIARKVADARTAGSPAGALDRERRRLEGSIRSRTLTTRGDSAQPLDRFHLPALLGSLGDRALVSIVDVDGDLWVLLAADGQVRRFRAGRTESAAREVDFARFGLRTAAGTGEARAHAALRRIDATADRLQSILLGEAVRALGDRPLVVVPPAKLHATPWAVLPALRERAFTVAPSAASWMRARRRRPPRQRRIVLVAGPDLGSRGAEIDELHQAHPDAAVFADEAAACDPVLKELDGAWLAHVAAHGVLRPDNPLFSALELHDGPLTVYDLERLRRAPYRLILSACESGIGATTGADEVLGLASALISLGTAGLMGSVVVVDDDAAVRVSLAVHERLRAGDDLSHALLAARTATAGTAVDHAAALAFLPLGAA